MDSAFGPDYETVARYHVGWRDVVVARENGGATTAYATSFHVMMRGSNPSTFNRVLVVPNDPDDLEVAQNGGTFQVKINGENHLNLERKQSFSGISFKLSFSSGKSE